MIPRIIAIVLLGVLLALAICKPEILVENRFLAAFISQEVLALMAIILTVTLAAVANIIVTINRLVRSVESPSEGLKVAAEEAKLQVKRSAWLIFYGFVCAAIVLFIKGFPNISDDGVAMCNALIVWLLSLYCLALFEIYSVLFEATEREQ